MKEIHNRLQCAYCIRNHIKGGECRAERSPYDESGCLIFKADKKGCIRNKDLKIPVALYSDIPKVKVWSNNYELNGVETEIRIKRINYLDWDKKSGYLYIYCNCDYYFNEFHKDYVEPKDKSILKVIK
jgi:hypothetical protein